jgi:phosphoserine phosphatase
MEPTSPPFAVVFDVDGTLAPDTTSQFLAARGVDTHAFWERSVARARAGAHPATSYLHEFVVESAGPHGPFGRSDLAAAAAHMEFFRGVPDLFARLAERLGALGLAAEFYLVSGGLAPIVGNLPIARDCRAVWASDFEYDRDGRPSVPGDIVDVSDKRKRLLEIARGPTQLDSRATPLIARDRGRPKEFRIPFRRMLFAGDGLNDVPCFELLTAHGGAAVAVHEPGNSAARKQALRFHRGGLAGWVAEADYTDGGEGFRALCAALEHLAGRAV